MRLLKVAVITIGMTIIGGLAGYEEGKRAHLFTKPTEADCAFYKLESQVSPDKGATLILGCDPTWNKDGKPVCSQDAQPDPLPQYTKPDTTTFEGLTPPSGSSDYQNYCDSYPKEPKVKVPTYGLKYWDFEDLDIGNQTTPYHPSFPKEPNPKVKPKECKPTPYWVICDDGFVIFGKAVSDDSLRARVCGKHGGVDNRQIHTVATLGKDWKVIVTPINPPYLHIGYARYPSL